MWAASFSAQRVDQQPKDRFRQLHRWIAGAFLITVAANFAAMTQGTPPAWITYAPLAPLFALMATGSWMLLRPYLRRKRV